MRGPGLASIACAVDGSPVVDRVLLTGAQGLLGRRVAALLNSRGVSVVRVIRECHSDFDAAGDYRVVDLASDWDVTALPKEVDAVVHLAQSARFREFPHHALDVFRVNVDSTARLLDYARQAGAKKFIYASSGGVYGHGAKAFTEDSIIVPPGQLGHYLGSKACGEILVQSYASVFDVVVLRPFFVYGHGQKRGMLIPRLFDSVANGQAVTLQGKDGLRINPVHVKDAAQAVAAALSVAESAVFNIAGPSILSIREICEAMGGFLEVAPVFVQQPGEPRDVIGDIEAMRNKLHDPVLKLTEAFDDVAT